MCWNRTDRLLNMTEKSQKKFTGMFLSGITIPVKIVDGHMNSGTVPIRVILKHII